MHISAPLKRLAYPMHHTYILVISYLNKEWKRYRGNISLYLLSSWNDDVPICRSILCGTLCMLKFLMLLRQYLARSVQFIPAYKRYQWLFHTTHTHTVWWIKCPQNIEGLCMRLNMRKWASLTGGCVSERVCAGGVQALSVIHANNMLRVAIRRALGYRHGYCHTTWIFRFSRCSAAANNAIRAWHCATGAIHNIHICANSVMEQNIPLLRFPRAWRP